MYGHTHVCGLFLLKWDQEPQIHDVILSKCFYGRIPDSKLCWSWFRHFTEDGSELRTSLHPLFLRGPLKKYMLFCCSPWKYITFFVCVLKKQHWSVLSIPKHTSGVN